MKKIIGTYCSVLFLSGFAVASNNDVLHDLNEDGSDSYREEEVYVCSGVYDGDIDDDEDFYIYPTHYLEEREFIELEELNNRICSIIRSVEGDARMAGNVARDISDLSMVEDGAVFAAAYPIHKEVLYVTGKLYQLCHSGFYVDVYRPDSILDAAKERISTSRNNCSTVKELLENSLNNNIFSPEMRVKLNAELDAFTRISSALDSLDACVSDLQTPEIDSRVRDLIKDFVYVGLMDLLEYLEPSNLRDDPEVVRFETCLYSGNDRLVGSFLRSGMVVQSGDVNRTVLEIYKLIRDDCDPLMNALKGLMEYFNRAGASEEIMTILQYSLDKITEVKSIVCERVR
ncbi:MAG: hypothetical protein LBQ43_00895 [Holosporales bacterium]|jgi:hypothetical protein|nr:hypothetical protein [Holosporales bacterium]